MERTPCQALLISSQPKGGCKRLSLQTHPLDGSFEDRLWSISTVFWNGHGPAHRGSGILALARTQSHDIIQRHAAGLAHYSPGHWTRGPGHDHRTAYEHPTLAIRARVRSAQHRAPGGGAIGVALFGSLLAQGAVHGIQPAFIVSAAGVTVAALVALLGMRPQS